MPARGPRIACLGALALAGAPAPAADGAPRGRVVRVERTRAAVAPRLCMQSAAGPRVCFGWPREGEHVALIDTDKQALRGDFVIDAVGGATEWAMRGQCIDSGAFAVKGHLVRGEADPEADLIGLRGLVLDGARARLLAGVDAPGGLPDESVELAVDTDGDDHADVVVTRFACDATGAADPTTDGRCYDTYVAERGRLRRTSRDILKACL